MFVRARDTLIWLGFCLGLGWSSWAEASWHGKVVWIPDGDTIYVQRVIARGDKVGLARQRIGVQLAGIDAPEEKMPYGKVATRFIKKLLLGKVVRIVKQGTDRYKRIIALVFLGDLCVNHALLKAGMAWHYKRYNHDEKLAAMELRARQKRLGLWHQKHPMPPWKWRRLQAAKKKRKKHHSVRSHTKGVFHGNIRSRVFHAPGCRYYHCKNCTVQLVSLEDAKRKGFRAHKRCVRRYRK